MSAHTPGPWVLEKRIGSNERDCGWDVLPTRAADDFKYRGAVCQVTDAEHIDGITRVERDANARLIAAAPDLLEALQELMYARTDKAEEMARDAIFRATGSAA